MKTLPATQWLEIAARRPLSPEETAAALQSLAHDPLLRTQLEQELALSQTLSQLPQPPISSNFTSRVLQSIDLEETQRNHPSPHSWHRFLRLPYLRTTCAAIAVLLLSTFAWTQHVASQNRTITTVANLARPVARAAHAARLPVIDILKDFDAIQQLSRSAVLADVELLSAIQDMQEPRP